MPPSTLPPREQLIRIQETLARRLRDEIDASMGEPSTDLDAYRRECSADLHGGYRRLCGRRGFLSALARADIVFLGEFHTLRACQACALWLLSALARRPARRRVVLALDAVPMDSQLGLDAYLGGEIRDQALPAALGYEAAWGFAWESYEPLFRFARDNEVQLYALNCQPRDGECGTRSRDARSAGVIAAACLAHPGAVVLAVAGELRIGRGHLPREVGTLLAAEGLRPRSVIVHQNLDSLYFRLARERKESGPRIAELARDEYCLVNSTPLLKYQSYLHWQLEQAELGSDFALESLLEPRSLRRAAGEAVRRFVRRIAGFLGADPAGLEDFSLYTTLDLDFLQALERGRRFSRREIGEIKRQILDDESYFVSRGNIIYLSNLSVDHAAEEAAHYVNNKLSGHVPRPLPRRTDFYGRILKEALGFLGSRLVNPGRGLHREEDFREILRHAAMDRIEPGLERLVDLSRLVLRHLELERRSAAAVSRSFPRSFFEQDLDLHLGITHSLGYILGDKLDRGFAKGVVKRSVARKLFRLTLSGPRDAEVVYFELARMLQGLDRAPPAAPEPRSPGRTS